MKKILMAVAVLCLVVSAANAHLGTAGTDENPVLISGIGISAQVEETHVDDSPWKGTFILKVKNTSNTPWGDFHFSINGNAVFGTYDPDLNEYYPKMNNVVLTGSNAVISQNGQQLDLFFDNTPVQSGQIVTFEVYTDNTATQQNFGICFYPTPVPEPATLAILGLGAVALLRKRK